MKFLIDKLTSNEFVKTNFGPNKFRASNFGRSSYATLQNKKVNEYLLTFDGFIG